MEDIAWLKPAGEEMSDDEWQTDYAKSLGLFLKGKEIPSPNAKGEPVMDDSFYLLFNAHHEPV